MISRDDANSFAVALKGFADREERAPLAALRRAAGKSIGEINDPYRYLPRWLASGIPVDEEAYFLVASLFALHQLSMAPGTDDRNLGHSFFRLYEDAASDSIESRFVAMLNAHQEEFPTHLRHAIGLLKSHDIPVDWAQLVLDVRWWSSETRNVQRRWARSFWGARRSDPLDAGEVPSSDSAATQQDA